MEEINECQIVQMFKDGDKQAFDLLYEKYKNIAFRMAYLISGNKQDSEDIVQETFIKCYQHIKELKKNEGFRSWLFQILTRTAWKFCAMRTKEIPDDEIMDKAKNIYDETPLDLVLEKERLALINKIVDNLDLKHKTVVILYYYNQLSTKEISKIVGCLEGTVKSSLFTARKQLKNALVEIEQKGVFQHV